MRMRKGTALASLVALALAAPSPWADTSAAPQDCSAITATAAKDDVAARVGEASPPSDLGEARVRRQLTKPSEQGRDSGALVRETGGTAVLAVLLMHESDDAGSRHTVPAATLHEHGPPHKRS